LAKLENEFKIKPSHAIQSLEANHHNSVTATYFLVLKQHLRLGGISIADARLKSYNKDLFTGLKKELNLKKTQDSTSGKNQAKVKRMINQNKTRSLAENLTNFERFKLKKETTKNKLFSPLLSPRDMFQHLEI